MEKLPPAKRKGKLLPEIDKGSGEGKELCSLVVDIVVSLLRCAAAGLAKEDAHFRKVLQLVEEVNPWLRSVYACLLLLPLIYVFCFSLFVCVCVPGTAA